MHMKICECCGSKYFSKSNLRKYCSKSCAREADRIRREKDSQLCWRCKNACGGCSWSACFTPVNGWNAEATIIKNSTGDTCSYRIKKCPEFVKR